MISDENQRKSVLLIVVMIDEMVQQAVRMIAEDLLMNLSSRKFRSDSSDAFLVEHRRSTSVGERRRQTIVFVKRSRDQTLMRKVNSTQIRIGIVFPDLLQKTGINQTEAVEKRSKFQRVFGLIRHDHAGDRSTGIFAQHHVRLRAVSNSNGLKRNFELNGREAEAVLYLFAVSVTVFDRS